MTITLPMLENCPKLMEVGPCGGVYANGGCEIAPTNSCVYISEGTISPAQVKEPALIAGQAEPRVADSTFRQTLQSGKFTIVAEINGADSADVTEFITAAKVVGDVVDVVSITDHSGANVHMGNVAATAHMIAAGVNTMPTFGCRDRNRMALQGDVLGVASLGVRDLLLVTGNHTSVGDSPHAKPVFDLDSPRALSIVDRLRTTGEYENGRMVDVRPDLHIGSVAHPFAAPFDDRARQTLRKVQAGADFIITQHIFEKEIWKNFVAGVNANRDSVKPFHLLGGVAIMPSEPIARAVNAGLRGFWIPEEVLKRLRQAKDPQDMGIEIAAETLAELVATEGISGALLAPVTGRQNALTASVEQSELIAEVRRRAGVPAEVAAGAGV